MKREEKNEKREMRNKLTKREKLYEKKLLKIVKKLSE